MSRFFLIFFILLFLTVNSVAAGSITNEETMSAIQSLAQKNRKKLIQAIKNTSHLNDPAILPVLEALKNKRLRYDQDKNIYIYEPDKDRLTNAITNEVITGKSASLMKPRINNVVRRVLVSVIALLKMSSSDGATRLQAAQQINQKPKGMTIEQLQSLISKETEGAIKTELELALAQIQLGSDDQAARLNAVQIMGDSGSIKFATQLKAILEKDEAGQYKEKNEAIVKAVKKAINQITDHQFFISQVGNLFYGISLGSVLLLAALGLAITFGLLGVINMAHGEMIMLGAYATYVVQNLFQQYLPNLFDFYLLMAIPVAFFTSCFIGMLLERTVIKNLYGRPLETLLATWGISLILIQTVRMIFGAQNVEVANPSWLSGGVEVLEGIVLPYNRIAIILFSIFVVTMVWTLLQKTSLGLKVRAVTQNRNMAASMGIATTKVDMWTFGIGSGVAGLGGVALSQIGNVGPELGQSYIVDSFMVVVLGGVGKIAGTVTGALGLGVINKFLEPAVGAVLGKILVLVFIILFIQKKPQGIFALKGRMAEN